jgi:molybdate transport system regulatory protein
MENMMSGESIYWAQVRVRLIGNKPFFDPGTAFLLGYIREFGSVATACEKMGLSYSKGRGMLRTLEQELGFPAVLCTKGGIGGGNTKITLEGERLLEMYNKYEDTICRYAQSQFDMLTEALQLGIKR